MSTSMQLDTLDPQTYLATTLTRPDLPIELKPFFERFQVLWEAK